MRHLDLLDCMALNDESQRDCESHWLSKSNHELTMARPPKTIPPLSEKDKQRFYAKIKIVESGCHEWQGSTNTTGYSRIILRGKVYYGHRIAFYLSAGAQPNYLQVCHKCDNPKCCNPQHLFLGTHQENMLDRGNKGRVNHGERVRTSKLTKHMVHEIRSIYYAGNTSQSVLAKRFGVCAKTISSIVNFKLWKRTLTAGEINRSCDVRVISIGNRSQGECVRQSKLTSEEVMSIRERYKLGNLDRKKEASRLGISVSSICYLLKYKTWRHLP